MPVVRLDTKTISQIAAGEVVENPSSAVKELLENALDAAAKRIKVKLVKGGLEEITVLDDGCGIPAAELRLALERYATSKITAIQDLTRITTLGFRGEALPSIAAVSRLAITTCHTDEEIGSHIYLEGGEEKVFKPAGSPRGTMVTVKDLFYNLPVRRGFLRSVAAETARVSRIVEQLSLSHPHISFILESNGKTILETSGDGNMLNTILQIFGHKLAPHLLPVKWQERDYLLDGYISAPTLSLKRRSHQLFFTNRRHIHNRIFREALEYSFKHFVTARRYPLAFLFLSLPPQEMDLNVHPSKMEVRFQQEKALYDFLRKGITKAYTVKANISPYPDSQAGERDENKVENKKVSRLGIFDFIEDDGPVQVSEAPAGNDEAYIVPAAQGGQQLPYSSERIIIGQLFASFILLQHDESLFIVDQHAAHERILWDEWMCRRAGENKYSQETLPFALELNLPLLEDLFSEEKLLLLAEIGLRLEQFGNNSFIVRTVPFFMKDIFSAGMLADILHELAGNNNSTAPRWQEEIMLQLICKAAVKANKLLSLQEMDELLRQLDGCDNPSYCPHGRPVIIKIKRNEIEKLFHRR